jgi:hypothetical protein
MPHLGFLNLQGLGNLAMPHLGFLNLQGLGNFAMNIFITLFPYSTLSTVLTYSRFTFAR